MRELDTLIGHVAFKDKEFPFFFDKESFQLTLIPPSYSLQDGFIDQWFPDLEEQKTDSWIRSILLKGHTKENYNIQFFVPENYVIRHHSYVFKVNYVAYSYSSSNLDEINGYKIVDGDVECFYPSNKILEYKYDFDDNEHLDKISLTAKSQKYDSCGSFILNDVENRVEVSAFGYSSTKRDKSPLATRSTLKVSFSESSDLQYVIDSIHNIGMFFEYITFRKNIDLHHIELFWKTKDGLIASNGRLLFKQNLPYENDVRKYDRVINYDYLGNKCGDIIELFSENVLTVRGIRDSIQLQRSHTPSTIIMSLATFEREYRLIYGQDYNRSQSYVEAKQTIIQSIDDLIANSTGKKKKHYKEIRKTVSKLDNSLSNMVRFALRDTMDIMQPFIQYSYKNNNEATIERIGSRINELRNEVAHSKLDIEYTPDHLKDIRTVEVLTYAIRLKTLGLDNKTIQKALSRLFDYIIII